MSLKLDCIWNSISLREERASQRHSGKGTSLAIAGDLRDTGLIFVSERLPGGGHGNPLHTLAWRIPRTEQPGELQYSMESDTTGAT